LQSISIQRKNVVEKSYFRARTDLFCNQLQLELQPNSNQGSNRFNVEIDKS